MKTQLTKHMLAFLAEAIFAGTSLIAQQPELYGTAAGGGEYYCGTIFKTNENGDNLKVIYNFPLKNEGSHPIGNLCAAENGKYYGTTMFGGNNNFGVLYEWDASNNSYAVKYRFTESNYRDGTSGSLVRADNNKLYGVTASGSYYYEKVGEIFEWDPETDTYTKKHDFTDSTGSVPVGSLMKTDNGKLYGMTWSGGAYGDGVLFEWDPETNTYTKKFDFNGNITGKEPNGALVQAANGKLYGMTCLGGLYGVGVLFEWDLTTNSYSKKFDFNGEYGRLPNGSLIMAGNGVLYGVTEYGGLTENGVLFEWNPTAGTYSKMVDFTGVENGSFPGGSLVQADGKIYGLTSSGGSENHGVLFEWDPNTNTYSKKLDFNGTEKGANPVSLTLGENNCLLGITSEGGLGQSGLIFEWNIDSETYTKKIDFNESENGSFPNGTLVQTNDENLYGTTERGGKFGGGVIFEWNNSTQTYIKKADFNGTINGRFPNGSLLLEDNGKLIGMTWNGGENDQGVIYEWDPFTNVLSKKFDFRIRENGIFPMRSLVQAGNGKFYGVAYTGGVNEKGVLFEWNPVTNIFLKKLDFDGSGNGNGPCGSLILADNGKLYGITASGGEYDMGVIFEWNPLTDTYTKKLDLHIKQNYNPCTSMMLADNGKFYGIICGQNNGSGGIIFEWDSTSNKIIEKIESHELGMFGGFPVPGLGYLMQARNGKIYGMNFTRGANDSGVLFEWDLVTNAFVIKKSFNMMDGTNPRGNLIEMRHLLPDTLKTDLIAYYPFNGNTYDKSGNGHHGTNNGAIPATDRFGNFYGAYNFLGEHNTLSFSGFQLPDPSFTISGWVKITNETTDTVFHNISKGIAKLLLRTVDHRYRVEISIGENQFILSDENGVFEIDTQHPRFDFLIVSYNGSEINLKINNRDIAHQNTEGKILKSMFPFTLKNDILYSCDGIVDDIRIFGRELNDAEMEALYSDRISTKPVLTIHPVEIKGSDFADISLKLNFDGGSRITETYVYWSTSPNPDTTNRKTVVYSSYDQAIFHLNGLQPNTTYYVKAYAINNTGVGYSNEIAFTTLPDIKFGFVRDVEGNLYRTVQIGVRNWMAENLKTTKYSDGDIISNVINNEEWGALTTPAYCWYNNDEAANKNVYGALYNWYTVSTGKLCPSSWHIPTDIDWTILENYLIVNGYNYDGTTSDNKIAKSLASENDWASSIIPGAAGNTDFPPKRNATGFSATPAGHRDLQGYFGNINLDGLFWTKTEKDIDAAWTRFMTYNSINTIRSLGNKKIGFSVRCVKDTITSNEPVDLQRGLVAYYPFNGNANDESGYGHNGVIDGATLTVDRFGNQNSAYSFNGEGISISVNGFNLPSSNTTISCWVKTSNINGIQNYISKHDDAGNVEVLIRSIGNRYTIEWTIGGNYFVLSDANGYYQIDPNNPRFDLLVLMYDGQQVRFYVNSTLVASKNITGQIANNNVPMVFGRYAGYYSGITEYFTGILDDIRIYNRALNNSEITALYNEIPGSLQQNTMGQPTGISNPQTKSIEMYPNPANTVLYFRNLTGNAKISIYDLQGRELISRVITDNLVDIGGLEYGIYTVRIEDADTTIIRKLIKQ